MTNKVTRLFVEAGVRYWEDATVNGKEDTDGTLIPFRKGDCWCPIIDLETGKIIGWPAGTTAHIHYKICDNGIYWLTNDQDVELARWVHYHVPPLLITGRSRLTDYIALKVDAEGRIADWRAPVFTESDWLPIASQGNNFR